MKTIGWMTAALVSLVAASSCSSTAPGSSDSGAADASGSSGGSSSGSSSSGGSSSGSSSSSSGGQTGCADGGVACPNGTQCCTGVPYPTNGACYQSCDLQCDRHSKQDIASVDGEQILDRVSRLPVSEWSYKVDPSVRHVGPMAQDFRASFGLGRDERTIDAVDEIGVTLAALQALSRRVEALEQETRELQAENARLRDRPSVSAAGP
jgi:hypothetical protein